jgi:hypothetical protein
MYDVPLSIFYAGLLLTYSQSNAGLVAVGAIVGYALSIPFANTSDRLAAYHTVRNNNIREAEMRLWALLPAVLIGPAGLVVYGMTAQKDLHWIGYFAGVAMLDWAALLFFTFTMAYALDSYTANMSEMLIAINVGKNAISFGMGYALLTWVLETGYAAVIAGAFGGVLLANNLVLPVFMWKGKSIRVYISRSWLARLHRESIEANDR